MTDSPLTSKQLERLAGVTDMYRTGENIWIGVTSDPLGPIVVGDSEEKAREAAAAREGTFTIHGPFNTPTDPEWGWEVERVTVHLRSTQDAKQKKQVEITNLAETDALFLTPSALEHFGFPYMAARYGPEAATEWYRAYAANRAEEFGGGRHWTSPVEQGL